MRKRVCQVLAVAVLVMGGQSAMAFGFCPLGGKRTQVKPRILPPLRVQAPLYMLTPQGTLVPIYPQQTRMARHASIDWRRPPMEQRLGYR